MIIYTLLKKITLLCLYYSCWKYRTHSEGLTVLTYHRISDEADLQDPLKVSVATFEKQIRYLKNHYEIISGDQLVEMIINNMPFPPKSCLITFDDGWRDNYTNAFKILKKYDVPAVIFICTDYIDTDKIFWYSELTNILMDIPEHVNINSISAALHDWPKYIINKIKHVLKSSPKNRRISINALIESLKEFEEEKIRHLNHTLEKIFIEHHRNVSLPRQMLSWAEVQEMSRDNIHIGSHTKAHSILTQISEEKATAELLESKNCIGYKLRRNIHLLAYPNGNYNIRIVNIAKDTGYCAAFTTIAGVNHSSSIEHCFHFKRKHVQEQSSFGFTGIYSDIFFEVELSGIRNHIKSFVQD